MLNLTQPFCEKHQIQKKKTKANRNICPKCVNEKRIIRKLNNLEEHKKKKSEYSKRTREHNRLWLQEDRKAHPERYLKYSRNRYALKKEEIDLDNTLRRFKISEKDYLQKFIDCDNKCEICKNPESRIVRGKTTKLCLDHNHETGLKRGILCVICNLMLGRAWESRSRIMNTSFFQTDQLKHSAIQYLTHHESNSTSNVL